MTIEHWVAVGVAFVAGQGFVKLVEIIAGWLSKTTQRKRSEVDRMAELAREAEARARVSARRERLATEWGHRNAVLAIRAGVPEDQMPTLDFKDDE